MKSFDYLAKSFISLCEMEVPVSTPDSSAGTPVLPYKEKVTIRKQFYIVLCLYIGDMTFAYMVGLIAPVAALLQDPVLTPLSRPLTDNEFNLVGSIAFVGVIIGAHVGGFISNVKGRKPSLLCGGIIYFISCLMLTLCVQPWLFVVGRLINGVASGITITVILPYIAEMSSTKIRGILLTLIELCCALSITFAYVVCPIVSYVASMSISCFMCLLFIGGVLFIPESPAFYVMKGKELEARRVLISLGRVDDIADVLSSNPVSESWRKMFKLKSNRRALFVGISLSILQQTSGITPVMTLSTAIFQSVKSVDANLSTIIVGVMLIISACITPVFVEITGRKNLILISQALSCIFMTAFGVYFYLEAIDHPMKETLHWLPLVSLAMFFLCYNTGFSFLPCACMSEMFDSSARSPGIAIASTCGWIVAFIVMSLFGFMNATLGKHVTFWIYAASAGLSFVFSAIFLKETKGKTLNEIQSMLNK